MGLRRGQKQTATEPATETALLDYREAPAPKAMRARLAEAEQRLRDLTGAAQASAGKIAAAATHVEDCELRLLVGRCDEREVIDARATHDAVVQASRQTEADRRALADDVRRMRLALVQLQDEALVDVAANLTGAYKSALRKLRGDIDVAADSYTEVFRLWDLIEQQFPLPPFGNPTAKALGVPSCLGLRILPWPELQIQPQADQGGKLGTFRKMVDELLEDEGR